MNIPLIFVAFVIGLLTIYMMNRFIKRPGFGLAFILLIQFLSATVAVFSVLENVMTIPEVDLAVIAGGILLPSVVVIYDHIKAVRRIKEKGIDVKLIESKRKNNTEKLSYSYFIENPEPYKGEIDAVTVLKTLDISDKNISNNIRKQLLLAHKSIKLKKYDSAALQYRFLSAVFTKSALIACNAGYLHCCTGKYREAYKILKRAERLKKQEKNSDSSGFSSSGLEAMIQFNLGYALYKLGKYEHSFRCFKSAADIKPELAEAYNNIARACLSMNMEDEAAEYLEKSRSVSKDSLVRIVLGSIYYKKGETEKALEVLDEIAAAETEQIDVLKYKGKAALKEKMFAKAEECFLKLTELEPDKPLNYYHLALAQRELKHNEDALKTYQRGIAVDPDNSMLLYNAATLLDEMGDREQAVRYLYRTLEGDEILEEAYNYLGTLLGQMEQYREADRIFDEGIRKFGNSYQLYFNRGIVLEMSRRLEDAAVYFEKAYEMNKNDQLLIYHYAAVLFKLRRYEQAISIYRTSLENYPDDAELYYGLSKVYAHMGEKDLAVDMLKKVIERDPSYKSRIMNDTGFKTLSRHDGYRALMAS